LAYEPRATALWLRLADRESLLLVLSLLREHESRPSSRS
jgi:hypothetical protein